MDNFNRTDSQVRRLVKLLRKEIYAEAETYRYSNHNVHIFMLPTLRDHVDACRIFNKHMPAAAKHTPPGKGAVMVINDAFTWARPAAPLAGFITFPDKKLADDFRRAMRNHGYFETYVCTASPRATESVHVTHPSGAERIVRAHFKLC